MAFQRTLSSNGLTLGLFMAVIACTIVASGAPYLGDILTLQQPDGREVGFGYGVMSSISM